MFLLLFLLLITGPTMLLWLLCLHYSVQGQSVGHLGMSIVVAFATTNQCGWIASAATTQNVVNDIMN